MLLLSTASFFSKLTFSKKYFRNTTVYQSVKQFGSRLGQTILSGLIWVHTICKCYQQETKVASIKERNVAASKESYFLGTMIKKAMKNTSIL